jgi:hypothetical protein
MTYANDRFSKFASLALALVMAVAVNGGLLVKIDRMATDGYLKSLPVVQLESVTIRA